ncbi:MAG: hypothetical protein RBU37_26670, partial [Myxococcota bacterium]|nr:hypothetical protein [Myxococcota bacterium]
MHKPLTSTPNTRLALRWAAAASSLAVMLLSSQANAQTTSSNWEVSTSIAPDLDDSELEYTVNVGDCRELVDDGDAHSFSFRK